MQRTDCHQERAVLSASAAFCKPKTAVQEREELTVLCRGEKEGARMPAGGARGPPGPPGLRGTALGLLLAAVTVVSSAEPQDFLRPQVPRGQAGAAWGLFPGTRLHPPRSSSFFSSFPAVSIWFLVS